MNTINNSRKKASVEKIERAFMEILQEKAFSEITVSEICLKAEVNRSTFYANFIDLNDLGVHFKELLLREFRNVYKSEIEKKQNSNNFLKLFYHIKNNQMLYRTYFRLGAVFSEKEINYDPALAEKYFGGKNIDYHIEFFRSGINAVIKKWLENGCKESPEEIENIIKTEYQGRTL